MNFENILVLHNFLILCTIYFFQNKIDVLNIHEEAFKQLLLHKNKITPSNPVLTITKFDGINTRNKVLKIMQNHQDLDEVACFKKKHINYKDKVQEYFQSLNFLDIAELNLIM